MAINVNRLLTSSSPNTHLLAAYYRCVSSQSEKVSRALGWNGTAGSTELIFLAKLLHQDQPSMIQYSASWKP